MSFTLNKEIAHQIWDAKYRLKDIDGKPIDLSVEDTWERIASALAVPESDDSMNGGPNVFEYANKFYNALEDFKFLPAGRIIAGAGTGRSVTLFNCFVMGTIPDSMDGIFSMLKEAALTMQQGGGIGYDFSTIRPKYAPVLGVAADASGPLTFMDCWDAMCRTVMSAGARRGAMMATMRCDHPDIMEFIQVKKDPLRLRMFNLSVLCTDDFMDAVKNKKDWDLKFTDKTGVTKVYQTLPAVELWDLIMKSTYDQAEPGVIFIDRINNMNNLYYCEDIASTNPCGEQPLPPYGACLLGSINLAKFVKEPFTENAYVDPATLTDTVKTSIRMLDNVIDVSKFPLPEQEKEAKDKRRIGLGVTGLADMLIMMCQKYGTDHANHVVENVMRIINETSYEASIDLAVEKGPFPLFNKKKYLQGDFIKKQHKDIRAGIAKSGIRNSLLTSIAPTGTISLYAGNVSSGIEPVFALKYTRKILNKDGTHRFEVVKDYALAMYEQHCQENHIPYDEDNLPDYFVTAQTITPEQHIKTQAAAQKWVDSSISKTTNVPEDIDFEDFKNVYTHAYDSGCKGCTTYRPNDITGSILSVEAPKDSTNISDTPSISKSTEDTANNDSSGFFGTIPVRPDTLEGSTYKIKFGSDSHAIYVTLTYKEEENGLKRPFEVFINSKNMEHYSWTVALTRMISAIFRRGGDVHFVVDELQAVFDPRGGAWVKGKYVPSVLAIIGSTIEQFMYDIGYLQKDSDTVLTQKPPLTTNPPTVTPTQTRSCQKCFSFNIKIESGCETCLDCGSSKCG